MCEREVVAAAEMPKKLPPSRPPSRPASGQRGQSRHNAMRQELGGQSAPSWSDTDPLVRADTPTNAGGGTMSLGGDGEGTTWWTVRRKKRAAVGAVLLCGSATILAVVLTQPITFPDCVTREDGVLDCTERAEALMEEVGSTGVVFSLLDLKLLMPPLNRSSPPFLC